SGPGPAGGRRLDTRGTPTARCRDWLQVSAGHPGAVLPPGQSRHRPRDVLWGMAVLSRADRAHDAALLAGLATGDPDVAAAFVRRFERAVYGMAISITRDATLAEDVGQEVFLRAWGAGASVLTWVLTITRNAAIDAVRARRQTPTEDTI